MRPFEVRVTASRRGAIVRPEGELDMATADDLERTVQGALCGREELLIDLRGLRFMDPYGLWVLQRACRRARERAIAVRLVPGTGIVDRLFDLTGTRAYFDFVDVNGDDAPVRPQTVRATGERRRIPA
jgi:anti-sigma B factor antagonist